MSPSFCCVCPNSRKNHNTPGGVSFHRFPAKDDVRRNTWIQILKDNGVELSSSNLHTKAICSNHFDNSLIDRTICNVRLKDGACPTLFDTSGRMEHIAEKELLCLDWPVFYADERAKPISHTRCVTRHVTKLVAEKIFHLHKRKNVSESFKDGEDANVPHNDLCIEDAHQDIKPGSNYNFADNAMECDQIIFVAEDNSVSSNLELLVPKNEGGEECDPLDLDREEQGHVDFLPDYPAMKDEFAASKEGSSFSVHGVKKEGTCDEYQTSSQSGIVNSGECPVKGMDFETDDRLEFKETLIVKEWSVIENSQQVEESSFEMVENNNAENVKKDDNSDDNTKSVTTDFSCEICSTMFYDKEKLNSHKIHCLVDWKPFICYFCKKKYWNLKMFKAHKRGHEKRKCFKCGMPSFQNHRLCSDCRVKSRSGKSELKQQQRLRSGVGEESKAKSKQKQTQQDIIILESDDQSNHINQSTPININQQAHGNLVPTVCVLPNAESVSKGTSEQRQNGMVVAVGKNCNPPNRRRLRKRPKVKRVKVVVKLVEESLNICDTCGRQFESATDFRVHTQLVLCKKQNLKSVTNLAG